METIKGIRNLLILLGLMVLLFQACSCSVNNNSTKPLEVTMTQPTKPTITQLKEKKSIKVPVVKEVKPIQSKPPVVVKRKMPKGFPTVSKINTSSNNPHMSVTAQHVTTLINNHIRNIRQTTGRVYNLKDVNIGANSISVTIDLHFIPPTLAFLEADARNWANGLRCKNKDGKEIGVYVHLYTYLDNDKVIRWGRLYCTQGWSTYNLKWTPQEGSRDYYKITRSFR